jgi:RelE-like HigB toxin of type II HigAB toxin-antitoxin system
MLPLIGEYRGYLEVSAALRLGGNCDSSPASAVLGGFSSARRSAQPQFLGVNRHGLVVAVDFEKSIVWIKWIGTHRDYDRIDVKQVKYEK